MLNKIICLLFPCESNKYRPKILDSNLLVYVVFVLFLSKLVIFSVLFCLPKTFFFADITKSALIELTNQERLSLGLGMLSENQELDSAAKEKADDMIKNGYFSHNSPQGITPWFWVKKSGYDYNAAGENLAIGFIDAEELFDAWVDSDAHRKNLINPKYKDIGIAIVKGNFQGQETFVVVQLLGREIEKKSIVPVAEAKEAEEAVIEDRQTLQTNDVKTEESEEEKTEEIKASLLTDKAADNDISTDILGTVVASGEKRGFKKDVIIFLAMRFPVIVNRIIIFLSLFVAVILLSTILIKVNVQYPDLILKGLFLFFILTAIFLFFSKEDILRLASLTAGGF